VRTAAIAATWLVTRGWLFWMLFGSQEWVRGDVTYFADSLARLGAVGVGGTLVEYPVPAIAVVGVPWLLAGEVQRLGIADSYGNLLMAAAALTDLAFSAVLLRRRGPGLLVWLVGVPLLGTTAYARFDLLPGVLAGFAVLVLARQPRVASVSLALATGIKLWPALLVPPVLAVARPIRRAVVSALTAAGAVLVLGSVALGGWARLLSPLTYQADRGLQIESVLATPAMLGWWADPVRWQVAYAPSKAYEVTGPHVDGLLAFSTVLTALYVVALALAWWALWRLRDRVRVGTALWVGLGAVTGFMVVGKVLSPQYLLWLLPVAAAGLVVADSRRLRWWTLGLLVATGLTQVVFPGFYGAITLRTPLVWLPMTALLLRNVLMVGLLGGAAAAAVAGLRRDAQRGRALERQPPGPDGRAGRILR
jgi:hypothetical protein